LSLARQPFCTNVLPCAEFEAHCETQAMHLVRVDSTFPSLSGTRQCAALLSTGTWQDRACKFLSPFICEGP
jgi:hypothetical protein